MLVTRSFAYKSFSGQQNDSGDFDENEGYVEKYKVFMQSWSCKNNLKHEKVWSRGHLRQWPELHGSSLKTISAPMDKYV